MSGRRANLSPAHASSRRESSRPSLRKRKRIRFSHGKLTILDGDGLVKPSVVVQVRFKQWTDEGRLRLPAYLGLRRDKASHEVHREG
jgi:ATP-dependent DNA ligase